MGPGRAAAMFSARNPDAERIRVTLFGSLALTGRGHGTDAAIEREVDRPGAVEIAWEPDKVLPRHPNGMRFEASMAWSRRSAERFWKERVPEASVSPWMSS